MLPPRKRRLNSSNRRGVTAVEFAVMFPIVLFITFGMLELSRAFTINDAARSALLVGARRASVAVTSRDLVKSDMEKVFKLMRISRYEISVEPEVIDASVNEVTIDLEVPMVAFNEQFFSGLFGEKTLTYQLKVDRSN